MLPIADAACAASDAVATATGSPPIDFRRDNLSRAPPRLSNGARNARTSAGSVPTCETTRAATAGKRVSVASALAATTPPSMTSTTDLSRADSSSSSKSSSKSSKSSKSSSSSAASTAASHAPSSSARIPTNTPSAVHTAFAHLPARATSPLATAPESNAPSAPAAAARPSNVACLYERTSGWTRDPGRRDAPAKSLRIGVHLANGVVMEPVAASAWTLPSVRSTALAPAPTSADAQHTDHNARAAAVLSLTHTRGPPLVSRTSPRRLRGSLVTRACVSVAAAAKTSHATTLTAFGQHRSLYVSSIKVVPASVGVSTDVDAALSTRSTRSSSTTDADAGPAEPTPSSSSSP
eukprot:30073-Pelagococcus_subviridis.AAC.3